MDRQETERRTYTEEFKKYIVNLVKAGRCVIEVSMSHNIGGSMTVYRWCKRYGVDYKKAKQIDVPLEIKGLSIMEIKKQQKTDKEELDKIKLLEYELALYKKLVEIAKRDYKIDLIKKLNTKPSEK